MQAFLDIHEIPRSPCKPPETIKWASLPASHSAMQILTVQIQMIPDDLIRILTYTVPLMINACFRSEASRKDISHCTMHIYPKSGVGIFCIRGIMFMVRSLCKCRPYSRCIQQCNISIVWDLYLLVVRIDPRCHVSPGKDDKKTGPKLIILSFLPSQNCFMHKIERL